MVTYARDGVYSPVAVADTKPFVVLFSFVLQR